MRVLALFVMLVLADDMSAPPPPPAPPLEIGLPIDGLVSSSLHDSFRDKRAGRRKHEAIDIMSPRGTPIRAVVPGTVRKLMHNGLGGITIYQYDENDKYCYYYAHLQRYAAGLKEGMRIEQGDIIGYVGSTGNATTPHLHFSIFEIGPEKKWWTGTSIDPYDSLVFAADAAAAAGRIAATN
ncbi:MAG TPA: M23 family metallopeptidase [Bryobacteraceae bacterium]